MASKLYNRAGVLTTTAGSGTITLGAALTAGTALNSAVFRTFASAGVADGTIVRYLILDSNGAWEYGTGTYTTAGTTLSRTLGASSTGSLLVLSGSAQVFITAIAEDIVSGPASATDNAIVRWDGTTGLLIQDSVVTIDDTTGLITNSQSLAANTTGDALLFTNPTAAAAASQRYSPSIRLRGQGWKTDATAASKTVEWYTHIEPVQGAASPSNRLIFSSTIESIGTSDVLYFEDKNGTTGEAIFAINGVASAVYNVQVGGTTQLSVNCTGGAVLFATVANIPLVFYTNNTQRGRISEGGDWLLGDGTTSPSRRFHAANNSAATNTVTYIGRFTSTSTGTPAVGIGAGIEFEVETAAGVNKVIATVEAVTTNVGTGTEAGDLVLRTMTAGASATEKGRTGFMPESMTLTDNITLLAGYSIMVNSSYTIPASLLLTIGAGAIMRIF